MSQEFRLNNMEEAANYFVQEIKRNELMSRNHKKVCITLICIEHFLISVSAVVVCTSISAFASLLGIPIRIKISAIGLKI